MMGVDLVLEVLRAGLQRILPPGGESTSALETLVGFSSSSRTANASDSQQQGSLLPPPTVCIGFWVCIGFSNPVEQQWHFSCTVLTSQSVRCTCLITHTAADGCWQ